MEGNEPTVPGAATRIRTLVDGNASAVLDIPGMAVDELALIPTARAVQPDGALLLHAPLRVAEEVAAVMELTDLAPVAVPHRVRGRAWIAGWLIESRDHPEPDENGRRILRLETAEASVDDLWGTGSAEPEELAAAAPDPLARHEAEMVQHLAAAHGDRLELLSALVPCGCAGARAVPVALDRFGLRVRYLPDDGPPLDARFDFPVPVGSPSELRAAMSGLFEQARLARSR